MSRRVFRDEWGDVVSADSPFGHIRVAPGDRVDEIQVALDNADRVIVVIGEA
jgi:hypothetical protein